MDSHSNLLEHWIWQSLVDYSNQKAHAITLVDNSDNGVLTAGHDHYSIKNPFLCIVQLEWDYGSLPGFTQVYGNEIEFGNEWKIPWASDIGYLYDWSWGFSTHNFYIVAGWDDEYTPAGHLIHENRAFCIAVNLDDDTEIWCELEQPHEDKLAKWERLVVAGSEIYCAGLYNVSQDGFFDSIILGMPDVSDGSVESNILTFNSLSFARNGVRIAYCDEAISDFIITIAKGYNGNQEKIVVVTWNSSGSSIDTTTLEISNCDNVQPFGLRYYPDSNAALMLISYRNTLSINNQNYIRVYEISINADDGTIDSIEQFGSDYLVPFQFVNKNTDCPVQLYAIVPKDFHFTDDGENIEEFEGFGCGTMRYNYDSHALKHNWLFEFEYMDNNTFTEIFSEESVIQTRCPSYNGIQFYSIPEEYGGWLEISVFDISGRQIIHYDNLSVVELQNSGIQGVQQGVYFVNIRCIGQNEYHTVRCIVLD